MNLKKNIDKKIQWIFIGEGRFKTKMKKQLSDEIEKGKVIFVSQQNIENLPTWVKYADFLYLSLNSSKLFTQTVPAKLQVYMALGKPILAMITGEGKSIINILETIKGIHLGCMLRECKEEDHVTLHNK